MTSASNIFSKEKKPEYIKGICVVRLPKEIKGQSDDAICDMTIKLLSKQLSGNSNIPIYSSMEEYKQRTRTDAIRPHPLAFVTVEIPLTGKEQRVAGEGEIKNRTEIRLDQLERMTIHSIVNDQSPREIYNAKFVSRTPIVTRVEPGTP